MTTLNVSWDERCDNAGSLEPRTSVISSTHEKGVVHAQNKQKRACTDVEITTTIGSQFGPGIAALAVLGSFHVFQVTPHIVGLVALCAGT